MVMEDPVYPVLVGNWMGVGDKLQKASMYPLRQQEHIAAVTTTGQEEKEKRKKNPLKVPEAGHQLFSPEDVRRDQQADPS